ncbi:MAG: hypothetical protein IPK53_18020 [bacterium]|nr:hypothetical protein [bacterium]
MTRAYFRDVYDHTLHVAESIDTLRDLQSASLRSRPPVAAVKLRQNDVVCADGYLNDFSAAHVHGGHLGHEL